MSDEKQLAEVLENLRQAIQDAEEFGLVRTEGGAVITGVWATDDGIVLVADNGACPDETESKWLHDNVHDIDLREGL